MYNLTSPAKHEMPNEDTRHVKAVQRWGFRGKCQGLIWTLRLTPTRASLILAQLSHVTSASLFSDCIVGDICHRLFLISSLYDRAGEWHGQINVFIINRIISMDLGKSPGCDFEMGPRSLDVAGVPFKAHMHILYAHRKQRPRCLFRVAYCTDSVPAAGKKS